MFAGVELRDLMRGIAQYKLILPVVFLLVSSANLIAANNPNIASDTTGIHGSEHPARADSVNNKPTLNFNVLPGILTNDMFGTHFVLDVTVALILKKRIFTNFMTLVYEHRFGNSGKQYRILDNDSLKSVDNYNANFWGLDYRQMLFRNPYQDLYGVIGAGYDWITVKKNSHIVEARTIGGLALNIGLGYGLYIAKKYGPVVEVIYHYASLGNQDGTKLDPSSLLIRLTFHFGPAQK